MISMQIEHVIDAVVRVLFRSGQNNIDVNFV
jgi:hypothetical protein